MEKSSDRFGRFLAGGRFDAAGCVDAVGVGGGDCGGYVVGGQAAGEDQVDVAEEMSVLGHIGPIDCLARSAVFSLLVSIDDDRGNRTAEGIACVKVFTDRLKATLVEAKGSNHRSGVEGKDELGRFVPVKLDGVEAESVIIIGDDIRLFIDKKAYFEDTFAQGVDNLLCLWQANRPGAGGIEIQAHRVGAGSHDSLGVGGSGNAANFNFDGDWHIRLKAFPTGGR